MRQINQAGLDLIKELEGLSLKAYRCPAGVLTVAYGHTGKDVTEGLVVTKAKAEELLKKDVAWAEDCVEKAVKVVLNDNQFAALVSFTYNVGCGAFKNSILLKKLNAGDYASVPMELDGWVKAKGKVLAGLVNRRFKEGRLFKGVV